jgi:hypothetical protein
MSRFQFMVLLLAIIVIVPIVFVYTNVNRNCIKTLSREKCAQMNFKDKLGLLVRVK